MSLTRSQSILTHGLPVQRAHLYLDPRALRAALAAPDLRGRPPREAAWTVFMEARIPLAWRFETLVDVGGSFRRRDLEPEYRAHWAGRPEELDSPVVKRYFAGLDQPRDNGDWSEVIQDGATLRFRRNGGPWDAFDHRSLVVTFSVLQGTLAPGFADQLREALEQRAVGPP